VTLEPLSLSSLGCVSAAALLDSAMGFCCVVMAAERGCGAFALSTLGCTYGGPNYDRMSNGKAVRLRLLDVASLLSL
jgi:hypothetical protein